MTRRTKKLGAAAKFGPRYGIKVKREIIDIEREKIKRYVCPNCQYKAVKRVSTGIWKCRHCGYMFAGGAYVPFPAEKR